MFIKKTAPTESGLEIAIADLHKQMTNVAAWSEEYTTMSDNLSKLYKLRENDSRPRVSPDTLALVAGNLLGIVMIVGHERASVVTSKALSFVSKLK